MWLQFYRMKELITNVWLAQNRPYMVTAKADHLQGFMGLIYVYSQSWELYPNQMMKLLRITMEDCLHQLFI